jgi:hypothetical protein
MGLLHDALSLGYITIDQANEMSETWGDSIDADTGELIHGYGYDASVYGDTSAFQAMAEDLEALGISDLANEAWLQVEESAYLYASLNEFKIFYDSGTSRWRWEIGTGQGGQFTYDPYQEIRF